jgi:anti-anti-sigma regulatory factor
MVGLFDRCVCIRVNGRANFTSGLDLKKVVARLAGNGYDRFILDLRECLMMDSTFLGVLSGIGLQFAPPPNQPVGLVSPPQRIRDLIDNLGVAHLFKIFEPEAAPDTKFEAVRKEDCTRADVTRICLEAHKVLMNLNEENAARFKDVARFLAEDLKRQEQSENPPPNGEPPASPLGAG